MVGQGKFVEEGNIAQQTRTVVIQEGKLKKEQVMKAQRRSRSIALLFL
jgi:hypothetical protein